MNVKSVPNLLHGVDVINQLGRSLQGFGAKNAFVITDKGLTKVGLTAQISDKIKEWINSPTVLHINYKDNSGEIVKKILTTNK